MAALRSGKINITFREANLRALPRERAPVDPLDYKKHITLPDLHGNPFKLIEELYFQGVLEITQADLNS